MNREIYAWIIQDYTRTFPHQGTMANRPFPPNKTLSSRPLEPLETEGKLLKVSGTIGLTSYCPQRLISWAFRPFFVNNFRKGFWCPLLGLKSGHVPLKSLAIFFLRLKPHRMNIHKAYHKQYFPPLSWRFRQLLKPDLPGWEPGPPDKLVNWNMPGLRKMCSLCKRTF